MTAHDRLADAVDRGLKDGLDALSPLDRELFRIQDFIIEYDMGSLSGYLYNRLPNLSGIKAAVAAMRKHGLSKLADLLDEAVQLFAGYTEDDARPTWKQHRKKGDVHHCLMNLPVSGRLDLNQRPHGPELCDTRRTVTFSDEHPR